MKSLNLLSLTVIGCLTGLLTSYAAEPAVTPPDPAPTEPAASSLRLLYLAPRGPLVVQFKLTKDGQAFSPSLSSVTSDLFAQIDANGDGELDATERRKIPPSRQLQQLKLTPQGTVLNSLLQSDARSKVITKDDLQAYFQKLGLKPFSVTATASSTPPMRATGTPIPNSAQLSKIGPRLVAYLDTDRDGSLSQSELLNAEARLRKVDLNLDEVYSLQEFNLLEESPNSSQPFTVRSSSQPRGNQPTRLLQISPDQPLNPVAIAQYYSKAADTSPYSADLPRESSKLSPELFQKIDRGDDGVIDADDWNHYAQTAPHYFEVVFNFPGSKSTLSATDRIQIHPGPSVELGPVRSTSKGGQNVHIDSDQLQFQMQEQPGSQSPEELLKDLFKRVDRDKNDYIDRNEAAQLRGLDFREMDTDNDGMVFLKEFLPGAMPITLLASRLVLFSIDEAGFDLFDAIDGNEDQRLSVREVRSMPELFRQWDLNRDNKIDVNELPTYIQMKLDYGVTPAAFQNNPSAPQPFAAISSPQQVRQPTPADNLPWFTQMDRNNDGVLSKREFLGKLELFERWDTDCDGLLTKTEALAATLNKYPEPPR